MNDTSRPIKRRHSTSSSRNMALKEMPASGDTPPRKEKSKRRSRSIDAQPTSTRSVAVNESDNMITSAAMDSTETLQRMSGGKEKSEISNGGYPRSSSVPSTAKEVNKATKKSGAKSSRDLKKHKSRRHSIPADEGQEEAKSKAPLSRESSTRSKKHRKPRSEDTASDSPSVSRQNSSRSSKHHKQRSPKAVAETEKSEQSNKLIDGTRSGE